MLSRHTLKAFVLGADTGASVRSAALLSLFSLMTLVSLSAAKAQESKSSDEPAAPEATSAAAPTDAPSSAPSAVPSSEPAPAAPRRVGPARNWWESSGYENHPERYRPQSGSVVETVLARGLLSSDSPELRYSPMVVAAPFGTFGTVDFSGSRLRSLRQSYGQMYEGTQYLLPQDREASSICGPIVESDASNAFVCFSQDTGEVLDRLPIPGELSAAPLFHNGSWVVATTKGFLFRSAGLSERGTPVLGMENTAFWGAQSRDRMQYLRQSYRSVSSGDQAAGTRAPTTPGNGLDYLQSGWSWFHWSSSAFTSPLLVQGSRVVALTANQFVYSVEFESGKIAWAQRIGTNEDLQIQSRALAVSSRYVVAGTADGNIVFLNPSTGKVEFRAEVPKGSRQRFVGVVAQPLVAGQRIVASNAGSHTVMVNERTQRVEWTLPVGSVASPQRMGETLYLGSLDGKVLKVDLQTGKILEQRALGNGEPVASLTFLKGGAEGESLLVALRNGAVHVLNAATLQDTQEFLSQGVIFGEFIGADTRTSACITTTQGVVRCFASLEAR